MRENERGFTLLETVVTCAIVATLCLALAALRPNPLVLVVVLVVLLSVPWGLAVARKVIWGDGQPAEVEP